MRRKTATELQPRRGVTELNAVKFFDGVETLSSRARGFNMLKKAGWIILQKESILARSGSTSGRGVTYYL